MKPFLILQVRPNKAGDYEYKAFCEYGGLKEEDTKRVELTQESIAGIQLEDFSAVIVGGGAPCVSDKEKDETQTRFESELDALLNEVVQKDFPYFGACYGLGTLVQFCGGRVSKDPNFAEDVAALDITITDEGKNDPLLKGLPTPFRAFAGHKESCIALPEGAVLLASSAKCPNHMIRLGKNVYATQFHPELDVENMLVRIDVYKNAGYFPPEEAGALAEQVKDEDITVPMEILKRFVEKYRSE